MNTLPPGPIDPPQTPKIPKSTLRSARSRADRKARGYTRVILDMWVPALLKGDCAVILDRARATIGRLVVDTQPAPSHGPVVGALSWPAPGRPATGMTVAQEPGSTE